MHYHIRVLLNNPIDPMFNFPEMFLTHVIKQHPNKSDKPNKNITLLQMMIDKIMLVRLGIMILQYLKMKQENNVI
jgi:hypothetical protein